MIGTKLAHYEITEHLGSGGMGDVYQATDLKLGRSVAVKFLPEAFARDSERLTRFEREARVLASLNHPNIAAIHGMEDADGKKFLVMELVDGETLAERIARGPIPLNEAIGIARQITESLEAAHASGIVHRDLKPANIKVASDGRVKVLDFGLAKALDVTSSSATIANSPTMMSGMSMPGMILGTAAYMSPEQARGKAVDKRTDIFAFGCVLFEMLTGRRAFDGEDVADILSRVIQREPDWSLFPANVPPRVIGVLRLCLEKNLRTRRSDIADVRIDLDLALNAAPDQASTSSAAAVGRSRAGWIAAGVAVVLAAAMALPTWRYFTRVADPVPPAQFSVAAPNGQDLQPTVAVSPDGQWVAFVSGSSGNQRVWLRRIASTETVELAAASGALLSLFWSPDSRQLGFFVAAGRLKAVDVATGAARVICETDNATYGGAWSADGTILFGTTAGVRRVPAAGGVPELLALSDGADPKALRLVSQFLPDGRHFLYAVQLPAGVGASQAAIYVGDVQAGTGRYLLDAESHALAAQGYILFVRAGTLFAQRFDANSFQLSGQAQPVQAVIPSFPSFAVSRNGVLALRPAEAARPPSDLAWLDRTGAPLGTLKKPPTGDYANPAISPDGRRVAVNSLDARSGRNDIWIIDTARDVAERFTVGDGSSSDPVWSPDGRQVAFVSERNGRIQIVSKAIDGSGEQVLEDLGPGRMSTQLSVVTTDWSPDGKFIVYSDTRGGQSQRTIHLLTVAERKSSVLMLPAVRPYSARFSHDGKWMTYAATDSGRMEAYIVAFPELNRKHQLSNEGGIHPRWGRNDREVFYDAKGLGVVDLKASGEDLQPGASRVVYDRDLAGPLDGRHHYAVAPDAQRLLVRQPLGTNPSAVRILVNWPAMLQH
jgi:Tol biopolymer transport system component/predicted Ser/Thr protein kinase